MRYLYRIVLLSIFFFSCFIVQELQAENFSEKAEAIIKKEIRIQENEKKWQEEKVKLEAKYLELLDKKEKLTRKKEENDEKITLFKERIKNKKRDIKEAKILKKEIDKLIEDIFFDFSTFVKNDVPFLEKERTRRIANVSREIKNPLLPPSEKFRRLFEAIKIEASYGFQTDTYQELITIDKEKFFADILKVGRVSLFFINQERKKAGFYDRYEKKWIFCSPKFLDEIAKAYDIASSYKSPDLVRLPIGKIIK